MKFFFWILVFFWICSAFLRLMIDGLGAHAGNWSEPYWGRRYLEGHFALEFLIVTGTGWLIYMRSHLRRAIFLGIVVMLLLPLLHYWTMDFEIGYAVRGQVGGELHEVDWVYHPIYSEHPEILTVEVTYPGYMPINRQNPGRDLRIAISKSGPLQPYYSSVFETDADPNHPECVAELANRYCRFFRENAWYNVHHQSWKGEPPGPSLKDMMHDIPRLFDGFKVSP